ncbi:MAG TPA: hypothetical protein VMA36_00440 [Candidatus Limnocylindria bacterium]|jgi:hypothetical protein|nr:hypothetical protein [Candidatus Limnocylindria bacterium]
MKRLLSSSLAALALFALGAPALAQHDDHHDRGNHYAYARGRDADYQRWQHGQHRYRHWHGRNVTYWNGRWGYWEPRGGAHIFINIPL